MHVLGQEGAAAPREALNKKAVAVIRRVQAKLTGRDFEGEKEPLDVSAQSSHRPPRMRIYVSVTLDSVHSGEKIGKYCRLRPSIQRDVSRLTQVRQQ
jgi:hypothetical protein